MSKSLVKELQELVNANVIAPDTAQRIAEYCQRSGREKPGRYAVVVNILGALLVGLGIVLVVAHNWDELGRTGKTFFAFLPLVVAQGFCLYVLVKNKSNVSWLEPAGVILFFAVATSISPVSQTYHINGTMSGFLLIWMLLTLPLVYILPSATVALLYIAGSTWYACEVGYFSYSGNLPPFYYLLLLALVIPAFFSMWKQKQESNFFSFLTWSLVLSVTIVLGSFAGERDNSDWVFTGYLALFSAFYILGGMEKFTNTKLMANPFSVIGILGIISMLMYLSYDWYWTNGAGSSGIGYRSVVYSPFFYFSVVLLLCTAWLLVSGYRTGKSNRYDPAGWSGLVFFLLVLLCRSVPQVAMVFTNLWILFFAVFFIRKGAMQNHLGIINFGLIIIAILAVLRFFDDEIPFIWRGLFFLLTGAGFFSANYLMVKKRKAIARK